MKDNQYWSENQKLVSQLERSEQIVDTCHNVRFAHISISAIHDPADRITESAK